MTTLALDNGSELRVFFDGKAIDLEALCEAASEYANVGLQPCWTIQDDDEEYGQCTSCLAVMGVRENKHKPDCLRARTRAALGWPGHEAWACRR